MVGLTSSIQAAVVSRALCRAAATAQTRAIQADRARHGTIAVVDALTARLALGLAEAADTGVSRAAVSPDRAGWLTRTIEAAAARTALTAESTLGLRQNDRFARARQTAIARATVRIAVAPRDADRATHAT